MGLYVNNMTDDVTDRSAAADVDFLSLQQRRDGVFGQNVHLTVRLDVEVLDGVRCRLAVHEAHVTVAADRQLVQ